MKRKILPLLFSSFAVLLSCSNKKPMLDSVDMEQWQKDKHGCAGFRTEAISALRNQKHKLLGLSEMEVVELLGTPDNNELYKRNQKFYYYDLTPSLACDRGSEPTIQLIVRFTAMGVANEISIE